MRTYDLIQQNMQRFSFCWQQCTKAQLKLHIFQLT